MILNIIIVGMCIITICADIYIIALLTKSMKRGNK